MAYKYAAPRAWSTTRRRILARDKVCMILGPGCTIASTEVDHTVPVSAGGTHHPSNLRGVCAACHAVKSETERRAGLARRARRRPTRRNPNIVD